MSPLLSIAADGIQRLSPSAGANVPWSCMCQSPEPIFSMLYQRAPARSLPTSTEWLVTSVCQPPKLRYCARHIPRSDSVWSLTVVPGCGMHAPKSQRFSSYGAAWMSVSCVIVIVGVPLQSTVAFVIWI